MMFHIYREKGFSLPARDQLWKILSLYCTEPLGFRRREAFLLDQSGRRFATGMVWGNQAETNAQLWLDPTEPPVPDGMSMLEVSQVESSAGGQFRLLTSEIQPGPETGICRVCHLAIQRQ